MDVTSTIEGIKLLALRPGDRLAILLPNDPTTEEVENFRAILNDRWPDVPTVIFSGDVELAVVRSEDDADIYDSWGEDA